MVEHFEHCGKRREPWSYQEPTNSFLRSTIGFRHNFQAGVATLGKTATISGDNVVEGLIGLQLKECRELK